MLGTCGTPQSLDAAVTQTVSARQSAQRSERSVTGKRRITEPAEAASSEWQEAEGGDRTEMSKVSGVWGWPESNRRNPRSWPPIFSHSGGYLPKVTEGGWV